MPVPHQPDISKQAGCISLASRARAVRGSPGSECQCGCPSVAGRDQAAPAGMGIRQAKSGMVSRGCCGGPGADLPSTTHPGESKLPSMSQGQLASWLRARERHPQSPPTPWQTSGYTAGGRGGGHKPSWSWPSPPLYMKPRAAHVARESKPQPPKETSAAGLGEIFPMPMPSPSL